LTLNDADVDGAEIYGATLQGAGVMDITDDQSELVSCTLLDCSSIDVTGCGAFVRNSIVNAATADGVAFVTTDTIGTVVFCTFNFSDGHGVEITGSGSPQASKGNRFLGYGSTSSNDAAIYNDSGASITINATDGASVSEHTYRNGSGASTTVQAGITVTFTGLVAGTEVRVYAAGTPTEVDGTESTGGTSFGASLQAGTSYDYRVLKEGYIPSDAYAVSWTVSQNVPINLRADPNYANL
jgi:hypothetical protein